MEAADNSAFSFFTSSTRFSSFTLNEECVLILDLPIQLMFNAKNSNFNKNGCSDLNSTES
jgi:hypothetical protein